MGLSCGDVDKKTLTMKKKQKIVPVILNRMAMWTSRTLPYLPETGC